MSKPRFDYPNDADGDALRMVAEHSDMSKPMMIDFAIDAPSEAVADICMSRLKSRDFVSEKSVDEKSGRWTVTVPVVMTPRYSEIVYFQNVLDEDLAELDAKSDGWGTFGNNPDHLPDDIRKALSE